MRLTISHETRYRYTSLVRHSTQLLRLTPNPGSSQRIINWQLDMPAGARRSTDAYGNTLHMLTLDYPHQEICVRASGVVETDGVEHHEDQLPALCFLRTTALTTPDATLIAFSAPCHRARPSRQQLLELMDRIRQKMPFVPGETQSHTPAAQAFAKGAGVCQDHTHVFLTCARLLGIPARYVSGYVYSPGHADNHVASHAWAEAWVDGRWYSVDVANGCPADDHHLRLAIGMDYLDACPIRGVRLGGGDEQLSAIAHVSLHDQ